MERMVKHFALFIISLKTSIRYKTTYLSWLLNLISMILPALAILIFGDLALQLLGYVNADQYLMFLVISLAYWGFIESFWSGVFDLRDMMRSGIIEQVLLYPLNPIEFVFSNSIQSIISALIQSVPLLIISCIYFSITVSFGHILICGVVVILSLLANMVMTLLLCSIGLETAESDQVISIIANIAPFLCGLFIPISMLPNAFLPISFMFPFTYALELLRYYVFDVPTFLTVDQTWIAMITTTMLFLVIGMILYRLYLNKARKRGFNKF